MIYSHRFGAFALRPTLPSMVAEISSRRGSSLETVPEDDAHARHAGHRKDEAA